MMRMRLLKRIHELSLLVMFLSSMADGAPRTSQHDDRTTVHSPSSRSGPDTLQVDKLRRNYFILYILPSVPPTICRNTVKSNESCFGQKIQLVSVTVIETNNLFIKMSRACYLEQLAKYCMPIVKTETMSGVI